LALSVKRRSLLKGWKGDNGEKMQQFRSLFGHCSSLCSSTPSNLIASTSFPPPLQTVSIEDYFVGDFFLALCFISPVTRLHQFAMTFIHTRTPLSIGTSPGVVPRVFCPFFSIYTFTLDKRLKYASVIYPHLGVSPHFLRALVYMGMV